MDVINKIFPLTQRERIRRALKVPNGPIWDYALQKIFDEFEEASFEHNLQVNEPTPSEMRAACDEGIESIQFVQKLIRREWLRRPFFPLENQFKLIDSYAASKALDEIIAFLKLAKAEIPATRPKRTEPTGLAYALGHLFNDIHDRLPKQREHYELVKAVIGSHKHFNTSEGLRVRCKDAMIEVKRELGLSSSQENISPK